MSKECVEQKQSSPCKPFFDEAAIPDEEAGRKAESRDDSGHADSLSSFPVSEMITAKEIEEENKLEKQGEAEDEAELEKRKQLWQCMEEETKEERYKRLQCLLMKSNMYTEYLLRRMEHQKEEEMKKRERLLKKIAKKEQEEGNNTVHQLQDTDKEQEKDKENEKLAVNSENDKCSSDTNTNSQKSTDSLHSKRSTRSKLTLRAPVAKSRLSTNSSSALSQSLSSPNTPGSLSAKPPVIESARCEVDSEPSTDTSPTACEESPTANKENNLGTRTSVQAPDTDGSGLDGDLGEIVSQMSRTSPSGQPREKFFPICFIQNAKSLDFSETLRDYLGEELIPYEEEDTTSKNPTYATSKRGRKRKALDYNEQTPQAAKLLTNFFQPSGKKKRAEEEVKEKQEKKEPELFCGEPDIDPDGTITRPALFTGGELRRYQIEGVNWLKVLFENGVNGLLADEMGLGKTIQCVALICQIVTMGAKGPFMIVAPLSTLPNWRMEFKRFAPHSKTGFLEVEPQEPLMQGVSVGDYLLCQYAANKRKMQYVGELPVVFYHGTKDERSMKVKQIRKKHEIMKNVTVRPVVITSYEIAMIDRPMLKNFDWTYMIVDEGHRLKNKNCRLIRELKVYKNTHRLLLTGTPLQNNLSELWSLLNFLLPEIFDDLGSFETWFDVEVISGESADAAIIEEERKKNILSMLHQILTPFMLRRVKADVDLDIPPKKELLVYAPLTKVQREFYESTVDRTIISKIKPKEVVPEVNTAELNSKGRPKRGRGSLKPDPVVEENNSEVRVTLNNIMMQLRKVCNHPYLIEYPLDPFGNYKMDEDLVNKCGKMMILDKMLPELKSRGHKVLIFSQMTRMLDILEDYLCIRKVEYCRLDGSCHVDDRQQSMETFNTDPNTWVFLLSTRAGGLGVNLVAADTVIIYDSDWNPQCDLQAQDRCHRIGQTKPVVVYRFVTANTIDQKIVERAAGKRKLEKMIIHKGKFKSGLCKDFTSEVKPLCPEELLELLKSKDHCAVVDQGKDGEVLSKEDLDALLDRSDMLADCEEFQRKKQAAAKK